VAPRPLSAGPLQLLILQPTPFCNVACDYCYLPDRSLKQVMSDAVFDAAIGAVLSSQVLDTSEFTILWHSGEPLVAGRQFYVNADARLSALSGGSVIHYALQTNATLITDAWCELFIELGIKVGVSLDGPAQLHDSHRRTRNQRGTHASVMRGIECLNRNSIPFSVIAVVTRESLAMVDEFVEFFVESGISNVGINVDEIEGPNTSSSYDSAHSVDEFRTFVRRLYELTKESDLRIRDFVDAKAAILSGKQVVNSLVSPYHNICVAWNGDFSTFSPELLGLSSTEYDGFDLGNILSTGLDEALTTSKFTRMFHDISDGVAHCRRTCSFFGVCGGGEPVNKYFENGTFRSSRTMHCTLTKQVIHEVVLEEMSRELSEHGSQDAHSRSHSAE
jgi:uncharacterized protein